MEENNIEIEEFEHSMSKVLATYEGRHVLMHLLQSGHVFDTAISFRDRKDFWEGRRSLAFEAFDQILTAGPETLTLCLIENQERTRRYESRDGNTRDE